MLWKPTVYTGMWAIFFEGIFIYKKKQQRDTMGGKERRELKRPKQAEFAAMQHNHTVQMQEDATQTAANNNRRHESHRHRFMVKARQTRELHNYTQTTKHTKSKPLSLYSTESHIQHGPDGGNNQNPQKQEKQRQQSGGPQQSSSILLTLQRCEVRRGFSRGDEK